jgi:Mu transposase, C-terminal
MTARQHVDPTPSKAKSSEERHEAVTRVGVIRPVGLRFYSLLYHSAELHALRNRMGGSARVMVRYDPGCLDFLYVLDPFLNIFLKVPRVDDGRRGMGLDDLRRAVRLERCREPPGERQSKKMVASKMPLTRQGPDRKGCYDQES